MLAHEFVATCCVVIHLFEGGVNWPFLMLALAWIRQILGFNDAFLGIGKVNKPCGR
jgi:hypothetical protein